MVDEHKILTEDIEHLSSLDSESFAGILFPATPFISQSAPAFSRELKWSESLPRMVFTFLSSISRGWLALVPLIFVIYFLSERCSSLRLEELRTQTFDGVKFIGKQEEIHSKYNSYCSKMVGVHLNWCLNALDAHVAWNSHVGEDFVSLLNTSCQLGRESDCQKVQKVHSVSRMDESVWKSDFPVPSHPEGKLKIVSLEQDRGALEWQEVALEGAVFGKDSGLDFVCGGLAEVRGTLVCATNGNKKLNTAIGRVVAYIEQESQLRSISDQSRDPMRKFWQGVNLKREDYADAVDRLRSAGELHPFELEFWKWLDEKDWRFFLAFNSYSVFSGVPSHEFLHAAYFHSSEFRNISSRALQFHLGSLNDVGRFVTSIYKTDSPFILINEFQAYLLQSGSPFQDYHHRLARELVFLQSDWIVDSPRIRDLVKVPW